MLNVMPKKLKTKHVRKVQAVRLHKKEALNPYTLLLIAIFIAVAAVGLIVVTVVKPY